MELHKKARRGGIMYKHIKIEPFESQKMCGNCEHWCEIGESFEGDCYLKNKRVCQEAQGYENYQPQYDIQ